MICGVAESPGHPAATRVQNFQPQSADSLQQRRLAVQTCDGLLMAMTVKQSPPRKWCRDVLGRLPRQKFIQQEYALRECVGLGFVGKELQQLVAKSEYAAWFKPHDCHSPLDIGAQHPHGLLQPLLG